MKARTALASSDQETRPIAPEVRLFRHIIIHAVLDAIYGSSDPRDNSVGIRAAARAWFVDAGEDFQAICECAGMNPRVVRKDALAYIARQRETPSTPTRPTLHYSAAAGHQRRAA
jgi:hypothetical protein